MSARLSHLLQYRVGRNGEEGLRIADFLIDEQTRHVRYLVVDGGEWLPHRKLLISPHAITGVDNSQKLLRTELDREQLEQSPQLDPHAPFSRSEEEKLASYYQWPMYWQAMSGEGITAMPADTEQGMEDREQAVRAELDEAEADSPLRSFAELLHYRTRPSSGPSGEVEDALADETTWEITALQIKQEGTTEEVSADQLHEIEWNSREVVLT
ncbi:MAG: PRC-barrel domain-containing protein [Verrucomicrobiota bacterium JB022]|nr:PRC-barrel domain-containing protein [Verrucomicrobiota bacterium JB022]